MEEWWHLCSKCGTLIKAGKSHPAIGGCPSGGEHKWFWLSKVGDRNYQCSKCKTLIQGDSNPTIYGCPSGGDHKWSWI